MTEPRTAGAKLPEITEAVLDQWEASASMDEEAGRTWSVHPLAVLAVVAEVRRLRAVLNDRHQPPSDKALTKLHDRAHASRNSRPWRIVDWLVHQLDTARLERDAARARVIEYYPESDTTAGVQEMLAALRADRPDAVIDWRYANTLALELAAVERERDRAVGSSRMWQQNAEETVDELAAALARIAAVEAAVERRVYDITLAIRDRRIGDASNGLGHLRREVALEASPTPTGPETAKRPCCARPGWCACDPLTPGDEHCRWFPATPEPTEETP